MSAKVKLSGKLAGDRESNALDDYAERLIEQPDDLLVVIGWVDSPTYAHDNETGTDVPTARLRRVVVLGEVDDVPAAIRDVVQAVEAKRLGRTPIPFEDAEVAEGYDPDQHTIDED